jgi:4-oxalocrotonate tautomerase
MPFVNVKVAGTLTTDQKREISERIADTLFDVAGKNQASTYIVFDEINRDNWAVGKKLLSD